MSILVFTFSLVFSLVAQQDHFTLKGLTNNIPENTVVYLVDGARSTIVDSAAIVDNQFLFKGEAHPYKEYWLQAQHSGKFDYKMIFVENEDMVFDASNSDFFNAKVSGSKLQSQAEELEKLTADLNKKAMELTDKMMVLGEEEMEKVNAIQDERATYFEKINEITLQFVKDHPDYLISVKSLTYLKNRIGKAETNLLYDALTDQLKATTEGQSIKTWLAKSVNLTIGDNAPDFQLPNLEGEMITLSNFKGKFVLLEFGASGCGPCRMENPNLLKAYQKYQENGFEILSVWLDKNQEHWSKTVTKDQMIWTTVSDLEGNSGVVPLTYNVIGIPDNYLLNPAGEIIAKDLRGDNLDQKLAELFTAK